ncbi:MAG: ATP-binding protein [Bacteroidales bacterium]|nr:ATP-binding protein [Bacteroidales bacterium]MDZ4203296.1 ATP-binding protein [Bacteroidales bacterium]
MTEKIAILRKYNFWDGIFPGLGLVRRTYLDKIQGYIGNNLIKVLVGQRRVGKSFILRQTIQRIVETGVPPANIFYLNKEYTDFDFISDYKDLDALIKEYIQWLQPIGKVYLFIDEVQDINGWERLVNSYSQSHADDYEVFISGSNAHMLSGELATILSGRYVEFIIFPFSYNEFIASHNLTAGKESFQKYLQTGGLPELLHLPNDEIRRNYMSSIRDAILLRDVVQRFSVKDARLLEDIFAFLVNNASNLVSVNNIINYFSSKKRKTNYETISNYIAYMAGAFIIHQAERYSIKGKDIIAGNCKYYINDLSFKNYLYPGFSYGYGYLLENLVYLQLKSTGFNVYVGYMRDREIDFVALKGNRTIYLQVAYLLNEPMTIEREYSQLEAIDDNFEKYVVSFNDMALPNRGGIRHLLAWQLEEHFQ